MRHRVHAPEQMKVNESQCNYSGSIDGQRGDGGIVYANTVGESVSIAGGVAEACDSLADAGKTGQYTMNVLIISR